MALLSHSFLLTNLWGEKIKKTRSEEALSCQCESEGEFAGTEDMLCLPAHL